MAQRYANTVRVFARKAASVVTAKGVLVLGASGHIGRTLIRELSAAGQQVSAASRDPVRLRRTLPAGVHAVRFDPADPSCFTDALDGVDRLFVLSPGVVVDSDGLLGPFLDRALARVRRVVTLTAQGVDGSDAIPHRRLELRVERAGVSWTHLRPTWFADNFHSYWRRQVHDGVIALPAADARTAFVDVRDVAACACAVLMGDAHAGEAIVLTGPEALDYHAAASVLSRATGRSIRYLPSAEPAFLEAAVRDGVPRPYAEMIVALFGLVRAGVTAEVNGAVRALIGRAPLSLQDYAAAHAEALGRAPAHAPA